MPPELPKIIASYIESSNRHDVKSMVACFSEKAVVWDEGEKLQGKKTIEQWADKTIKKYGFQYRPLAITGGEAELVLANEVSGNFDGSPIQLKFNFVIENGRIQSLRIE
jgi:hypothetical protein